MFYTHLAPVEVTAGGGGVWVREVTVLPGCLCVRGDGDFKACLKSVWEASGEKQE